MVRRSAVALLYLLVAACGGDRASDAPAAGASDPAPVEAVYTYDGWIGRWTGVEGMFLDVQPDMQGGWMLTMQSDLDSTGTYPGTSTAEGIAFERDGQTLVLREATGDETGLKWLEGKQDCLMVAEGEGYCRD